MSTPEATARNYDLSKYHRPGPTSESCPWKLPTASSIFFGALIRALALRGVMGKQADELPESQSFIDATTWATELNAKRGVPQEVTTFNGRVDVSRVEGLAWDSIRDPVVVPGTSLSGLPQASILCQGVNGEPVFAPIDLSRYGSVNVIPDDPDNPFVDGYCVMAPCTEGRTGVSASSSESFFLCGANGVVLDDVMPIGMRRQHTVYSAHGLSNSG